MKFFRNLFIAAVLSATAAHAQILGAGNFDRHVNDFAEVLSDTEESRLQTQLETINSEHNIQMMVVTIDSLASQNAVDLLGYTTTLFNRIGVGDRQLNNGVMILVSVGDRMVNVELGASYGHDHNDAMAEVIENRIMPEFRSDDYAGGLEEGAAYIIYALTGTEPPAAADSEEGGSGWGIFAVIGGIIAAIGAFFGISAKKRNTAPKCPDHDVDMERLDEDADDAYLSDTQRLEERLESRNYDVWKCPKCDKTEVREYGGSKSGSFQKCPKCEARTLEGTKTVVRRASVKAGGLERTDYHCHNCDHSYSEEKTTAKLERSDGGKSGGGGASGEW